MTSDLVLTEIFTNYYRESAICNKKSNFWQGPTREHHRMCLILCRWIVFGVSFKHMPAISKVIWSFWEIWKTKSVHLRKPGICFSNYPKNDNECWKSRTRLKSIIYLQKMRYIRWCLVDLKLVKGLIFSYKRLGFSVKINISVKKCEFEFFLLLLSYRIGLKL